MRPERIQIHFVLATLLDILQARPAAQYVVRDAEHVIRFVVRQSGADTEWESTPFVAGSAIYAVRPMFNLMLEIYNEWRPGTAGHDRATTIAHGFRGGWNLGEAQLILGLAFPVTRGAFRDHGVLGYVSYELPFTKNR